MIGTYNESSLHKALKEIFCPKDGKTEQAVNGFICDILCKNNTVIEIQTANLTSLRTKLEKLLPEYGVEIVYPISENTLVRLLNEDGSQRSMRKSPKHGSFFQIFKEISGLHYLTDEDNLCLTIAYIESEVVKIDDKKGKSRFKNPRIADRKLIKIIRTEQFESLQQICLKVLNLLPEKFTNRDLKEIGAGKYASYTSYFLKKAGLIKAVGKDGRFVVYSRLKKTKKRPTKKANQNQPV